MHRIVIDKGRYSHAENSTIYAAEKATTLGGKVVAMCDSTGWIYDEEHPTGDNFVDFGIYNLNIEKARDFVNGYERSIILDFNVDGPIMDLI